eukprot:14110637-Alexandrium_andersonii.AAC.1
MSASLVGSEMCIRDRVNAPLRRPSRTPLRASPGNPARPAEGRPAPHVRPVSYTHLTLPTICSV